MLIFFHIKIQIDWTRHINDGGGTKNMKLSSVGPSKVHYPAGAPPPACWPRAGPSLLLVT